MQHRACEPGKVETALVEGATHIRLAGECDMLVAPAVHEHVDRVLARGDHRIIFDLENVTFMDSSILSIFLMTRRASPDGREVVLLCRPGFVRRLLNLLEMDRILRVCTPEEWRQQTASVH
jgi:anti-sigma B factor antagonist